MDVTCVILDRRPAYPQGERSLLLLPIGVRRLLERLDQDVVDAHWQLLVVPDFEATEGYAREIGNLTPRARILARGRFSAWLLEAEPSDWVMILDAQRLLADPAAIARVQREPRTAAARHFLPLERSAEGTREHIHAAADGTVLKVERLYEGQTQVRAGGPCATWVSVAGLRAAEARGAWGELGALRVTLAAQNIPSLDVLLERAAFDLGHPAGLVALCEDELAGLFARPPEGEWQDAAPQVRVHARARIHPEARLVGPLVVHRDATIDAGAMLLGPAVVGEGATVAANAVVSESLVLPRARVESGRSVLHQVHAAQREGASPPARTAPRGPSVRRPAGKDGPWAYGMEDRLPVYPLAKRWIDAALAAIGLVVLSPLLLGVAVLVKLTSRGPILFGHEREGLGGRPFRCWKFRTMVHHAHNMQRALYRKNGVDGPQFKLADDPRITRLGGYLRLTNLDEIPQLWNVLLGQMSLIGPRPSPFRENQICVPWRKARLSVRPGITGLWQICRHDRAMGDFHQWIHFDTLYVRHMSAWLDFKILVATALTLGGRWSVPMRWMVAQRRTEAGAPVVGAAPAGGWLDLDLVCLFHPAGGVEARTATGFDTIGRQAAPQSGGAEPRSVDGSSTDG